MIIIIPLYNEQDNVKFLLDRISSLKLKDCRLIMVDDGSKDNTVMEIKKYMKKLPIYLIEHGKNIGPGRAFYNGFKKATEIARKGEVIITMEADSSNDLNLINKMSEKINNGYDLVIATSCWRGGKIVGAPFRRVFLSHGINVLLKTFFPIKKVTSYTCFFRAHNADFVKKAYRVYGDKIIYSNGFVGMPEILINMSRLRPKIDEVPMIQNFGARKGKSKMKVGRTVKEYLKMIYRFKSGALK